MCCLALFASLQAMAEMPGPDPKALWEYMTKTSPYTQWKFWDDHQGMLPGDEPHGSFHKVYVNDIAYASTSAPTKNGSVVVKGNYNDKKELMAFMVIYKVEGYNPSAGDWFWVRYTPEGKAKPPDGKIIPQQKVIIEIVIDRIIFLEWVECSIRPAFNVRPVMVPVVRMPELLLQII